MNNKTPYQILKHYMDQVDSRLRSYGKTSLNRRSAKSDYVDYTKYERKAIEHDLIVLWTHYDERKPRNEEPQFMNHMTMAFSFDYINLESSRIRFSYSDKNKHKQVIYSNTLDVATVKIILKSVLKAYPQATNEDFIQAMKEAFIDGKHQGEIPPEVVARNNQFIEEQKAFLNASFPDLEEFESMTSLYHGAVENVKNLDAEISKELEITPEYAEVARLEKELSDARAKLQKVRDQKRNENKMLMEQNNIRKYSESSSKLDSKAADILKGIIERTHSDDPVVKDARSSTVHHIYERLVNCLKVVRPNYLDKWHLDSVFTDFKSGK